MSDLPTAQLFAFQAAENTESLFLSTLLASCQIQHEERHKLAFQQIEHH